MKQLLKLLVFGFLFIPAAASYALPTADVDVRAVVPEQLDLAVTVRKVPASQEPYGPGSSEVSSIDFGTLAFDDTNNIFVSNDYFSVFLVATTSGRAYRIQQTNNGVISTGGGDLNNNLVLTPDYQAADEIGGNPQGTLPGGDSLGSAQLSFGAGKVIYNGNAGLSRRVRAYYGIATGAAGEPAGAEPITTNKLAGTYTGTVTFSVVLQ